jgi:glycosyltransferase involved in cell wall biosynthesis
VSYLAQADSGLQLTLHTGNTSQPIIQRFKNSNARLIFYKGGFLGRFKGFKTQLEQESPDLLHGHGLWQQPVHQMVRYAQQHQIPYIITPRGMLEPWSLTQSRLKKQLALKLYQAKDLHAAACLHATAEMEAQQLRALGFKNPIAVIPNGIDLAQYPLKTAVPLEGKRTLLFLSRLHPKKGIELLIEAWATIAPALKQDWQVAIVGNGAPDYVQQLQDLISARGLQQDIALKPPLFGAEKIAAYHNAQLFVLPTYSENFGIVVAEALACGTPVITTQGTPWQDLETHGCGWWIPTEVTALKATLETALQLDASQLAGMGIKGRALMAQQYSMTAVAGKMLQVYRWLLGTADRPEFVYLD